MEKLYNASIQGSAACLLNLLNEDPLIIHKYISKTHHSDTPLHIAALLGHEEFVKVILRKDLGQIPDLTRVRDSDRSTSLHLASAMGHVEIVRDLIEADPGTCLFTDIYGMNPAHVAVAKGKIDALRVIVQVKPESVEMITDDKSTILHLCVKYNQLESMKMLLENNYLVDENLLNANDEDGNTILHLAALNKQSKTVDFLLKSAGIDTQSQNAYGQTAFDISKLNYNSQSNRHEQYSMMRIQEALRGNGSQSSASITSNFNSEVNTVITSANNQTSAEVLLDKLLKGKEKQQNEQQAENWRNAILIASTVIVSMSFQVAANPPGGVWQDTSESHVAGQAIMATVSPRSYRRLIVLNTVSFCGSAFVFLLLLSRLPFVNNKYVIRAFNVALWLAILSSAICFTCSVIVTTPVPKMTIAFKAANAVMYLAFGIWGVIVLGHFSRFIRKKHKKTNGSSMNNGIARV